MKIFGYSYNNPDNLLELSECTLDCNLKEIDEVLDFLLEFKNKVEKGIQNGIWNNDENVIVHEHFCTDKKKQRSDFIIVTRINGKTEDDSNNTNQGTPIRGRFCD